MVHPTSQFVTSAPLEDAKSKRVDFEWNDKFEAPAFRWIFNNFFTDLLVEHDINAWSLSFKDKDMDKKYSKYLVDRTLSRWTFVLLFAFVGGGTVIASDYYHSRNAVTAKSILPSFLPRILTSVISIRAAALVLLLIPALFSAGFLRSFLSNRGISLIYFLAVFMFFVTASVVSVLLGLPLNMATFCLIFDISLLVNYTFLNQRPFMAVASGAGLYVIVFAALWIVYVVVKKTSFQVVTFAGIIFSNVFLLIAFYQASLLRMVLFVSAEKSKNAKWLRGKVPVFTEDQKSYFLTFRNRIMESSCEAVLMLLLVYNFIRLPLTLLPLHPQLMMDIATFYFIPLSMFNLALYILLMTFLKNPGGSAASLLVCANLLLHTILYSVSFHLHWQKLGIYARDIGILSPVLFMLCANAIRGLPEWASHTFTIFTGIMAIVNTVMFGRYQSNSLNLEVWSWVVGILFQVILVIIFNHREEVQLRRLFLYQTNGNETR